MSYLAYLLSQGGGGKSPLVDLARAGDEEAVQNAIAMGAYQTPQNGLSRDAVLPWAYEVKDGKRSASGQLALPQIAADAWDAVKAVGEAPLLAPYNPTQRDDMIEKSGAVVGPMAGVGMAAAPRGALGAFGGKPAEAPTGIRAYHGSPHDFDRFDLSKIGTGEGAQAYGHGLYFAENEGTAKIYKDVLKDAHNVVRDPSGNIIDNASMYGADPRSLALHRLRERGDFETAIGELRREADNTRSWRKDASKYDEAIAELERMKAEGYQAQANPGRMYEVSINARPEDFLDWDKPLSQQSDKVQAAVKGLPLRPGELDYHLGRDDRGGFNVVRAMNNNGLPGDKGTAALREAGIPGIKYLDQGSRATGEGSRNYVVFDDALISILRKYGLLPPAAAGAVAASQPEGQQN